MARAPPRRRKVDRYDGQTVWIGGEPHYELGNYLGGGAAGVVHEAVNLKARNTPKQLAMKILNPVGFKLMPNSTLQRCIVARKGSPATPGTPMTTENVWWVVHPISRAVIAAYQDPRSGQLRELTLPRCIECWGWDPLSEGNLADGDLLALTSQHSSPRPRDLPGSLPRPSSFNSPTDEAAEKLAKSLAGDEVLLQDGTWVTLPRVPPKYVKWLRSRQGIYREISNMAHLGEHKNVVSMYEVLEYVQDSKSTLFLALELVTGGELFDRIKIGRGTSEEVAQRYFRQLLDGVGYCHAKGVCHRDLKPENLLLSDPSPDAAIKIADFGLSAAFAIAASGGEAGPGSGAGSSSGVGLGGGGGGGGGGGVGGGGGGGGGGGAGPGSFQSPCAPPLASSSSASPPPLPPSTASSSSPLLGSPPSTPVTRRLRSVVGSPHYVAPEVTTESVQGYDGPKADVWSAGVILYAMLAGNLPFGKDVARCQRYSLFRKWFDSHDVRWFDGSSIRIKVQGSDDTVAGSSPEASAAVEELDWFYPEHMQLPARILLLAMLHPEPCRRATMDQASRYEWTQRALTTGAEDVGAGAGLATGLNRLDISRPTSWRSPGGAPL